MDNKTKIDVIVVGAGPSGVACAVSVARQNNRVLVIEKSSSYGTKNMFGGAVYLKSLEELFPKSFEKAPYERFLTKHNYVFLNEKNSTLVSYENKDNKSKASITRFEFDSWMVKNAMDEGVFFAPNTLVIDLIKEGNRVIGVKTENEEIYSDVVVLAEGFNSILANKIGLKKITKPKSAILGVKETLRLKEDLINTRFNLKNNEGAIFEFFGGLNEENEDVPLGMGFLYTFKNSITLGAGVSMESLKSGKVKPYEYLNRLKNNEFIKPLIEGAELVEYSAHSIPEGGYNELPKLYDNGVLLVGDCANLVDSVHFEGTNLAIKSGMIAGEVINGAIKKKDFSRRTLKWYKKRLYKTFVIQDLKTYRNVIPALFKRRKSVFLYYPKKMNEFFNMFTTAGNENKKENYRRYLFSFLKDRPKKELLLDVISFVKCVLNVIV